jgi:hypothetical protein
MCMKSTYSYLEHNVINIFRIYQRESARGQNSSSIQQRDIRLAQVTATVAFLKEISVWHMQRHQCGRRRNKRYDSTSLLLNT